MQRWSLHVLLWTILNILRFIKIKSEKKTQLPWCPWWKDEIAQVTDISRNCVSHWASLLCCKVVTLLSQLGTAIKGRCIIDIFLLKWSPEALILPGVKVSSWNITLILFSVTHGCPCVSSPQIYEIPGGNPIKNI